MLVAGLQTAFSNKAIVIAAFGFRLPLILLIVLRLSTFNAGPALTRDFTITEDLYLVWTETQLNYSLVSATIPIFRPFINSLSTNYGIGGAKEYSGSVSQQANTPIKLNTLSSDGKAKSKRRSYLSGSNSEPFAVNPSGNTFVTAYHPDRGSGKDSCGPAPEDRIGAARVRDRDAESVGSDDSQRMIIRKNVEWSVIRDNESTSALG